MCADRTVARMLGRSKQIENQIAVWQAQIRDHQDRLAQAGAEARANYEKAIASMRENVEQVLGPGRANTT